MDRCRFILGMLGEFGFDSAICMENGCYEDYVRYHHLRMNRHYRVRVKKVIAFEKMVGGIEHLPTKFEWPIKKKNLRVNMLVANSNLPACNSPPELHLVMIRCWMLTHHHPSICCACPRMHPKSSASPTL